MNKLFISLLTALAFAFNSWAGQVPVHDPSIVIVYKDAQGNSFPEQSAQGDRTKYYFVMGTQLGAAYSQDMLNWTEFTPSFAVNGVVTTDYTQVFRENAIWSGWANNNAKLKENLWAADIMWNRDLKKWCMYYSVNGDDWLSSICMLSSDKIEGPYTWQGSVVFGGMDGSSSGAGNNDFKRVTGQSTIPSRYFASNGGWGGTYGSSCIDPNVLYDEEGELWLVYGSWSGGIFMLKLDNKTGLRDYNYNYGYTPVDGAVWSGSRLRYDEYMGIHIAGGYYVSGEGPYIEYMVDEDGEGYYYLFMSYGFYSPEGGYNMRLFRSKNITGPYIDPTGDDAVFHKAIYPNYGANTTYGISLMQNYSWLWWSADKNITDYGQVGGGQTAQGHNSALRDEDGKCYIIYHTKDNTGNGYGWHHVESHPMVFASDGWPLVAPFETRLGEYTDKDTMYKAQDIIGEYQVITHAPVDYEKLYCHKPGYMQLNGDKSISGAYTGTWEYDYANGKQFLTLKTSEGTFNGTLLEQRMEDDSRKTLCLTSMNPENELTLWAFRNPQTKYGTETVFSPLYRVGEKDKSLVWNEKEKFLKVDAPNGDFEIKFSFHNYNKAENNWDNWALHFDESDDNTWALRADAYSINTFTGSTVSYSRPANWRMFDDKDVEITIIRQGTSINVSASVDGVDVYGVLSKNSPTGKLTVYLGGESTYLDVNRMSVSSLKEREKIGTVTNFGRYQDKFNVSNGATQTYKGDFKTHYSFNNFHSSDEDKNWNNFIIKNTINGKAGLIRADAYQLDCVGNVSFETSWGDDWATFVKMLQQAKVDIDIERNGTTITYDCHIKSYAGIAEGLSGNMLVTQTGITTDEVMIGLTEEASLLDVLGIMEQRIVEVDIDDDEQPIDTTPTSIKETESVVSLIPSIASDIVTITMAEDNSIATLYSANGIMIEQMRATNGKAEFELTRLAQGVYIVIAEGKIAKIIKK